MCLAIILALPDFYIKFTVRYRKSENWMMETVYSELKVRNLLYVSKG